MPDVRSCYIRLRMLQLMYECSDICTNATIYVRKDTNTFTLEGENLKKMVRRIVVLVTPLHVIIFY